MHSRWESSLNTVNNNDFTFFHLLTAAEEGFREQFFDHHGISELRHLHPAGTDSIWGKIILELVRDGKTVCFANFAQAHYRVEGIRTTNDQAEQLIEAIAVKLQEEDLKEKEAVTHTVIASVNYGRRIHVLCVIMPLRPTKQRKLRNAWPYRV
jgi:hypothetical protein